MDGIQFINSISRQIAANATDELTKAANQQNTLIDQKQKLRDVQDSFEAFNSAELTKTDFTSKFTNMTESLAYPDPASYLDDSIKTNSEISNFASAREVQLALANPKLDFAGGLLKISDLLAEGIKPLREANSADAVAKEATAGDGKSERFKEILTLIIQRYQEVAKAQSQSIRA
jgi:hypothetical protein